MIKLICDSTAYLPKLLIKKYDIEIISLSVILGSEVITETKITNEAFFNKLENSPHHPTSSQPTVEILYNTFEKHISKGDSVIFTCISSEMSGTYSTAVSVKEMIKSKYEGAKIEIVDSKSNCMQLGYAVLAGAKQIAKGNNFEDTVAAIRSNISSTRMLFIPETLRYLQKSGRLSKAGALAASVLKIVPILTITDGKADVFAKIRTKIKARKAMVSELIKDISAGIVTDISVMHINNEKEAGKLIEAIKNLINIEINLTYVGPVIGAHVGPGTIGIAWVKK